MRLFSHGSSHRHLPANNRLQRLGRCMNLLCIATSGGCFNGFGCIDHHAVVFTQSGRGFFALQCFALEGVVNRLSESVPHFLFLLTLNRHALRFMLPALLQVLDGVNVQHRLSAQHHSFFNHGFAPGNAL